jgi:hypothetical protein
MALDQTTDALLQNIAAQGGPALHEMPVDTCRDVFFTTGAKFRG